MEGAVLSYLLGVFSKENVAILPFFIALYEFYFFQNLDLSPKGKKILFILIGSLLVLGAFGFLLWGKRYIDVIIEGYQYGRLRCPKGCSPSFESFSIT